MPSLKQLINAQVWYRAPLRRGAVEDRGVNHQVRTHDKFSNNWGFTVLELMVAIVIFTLGFLGAYLLIQSANEVSIRSRDEIVGANILREQVELIKNLRDSNWITLRNWNSIASAKDPSESDTSLSPGYYTIENDYREGKTIRIRKLAGFTGGKDAALSAIRTGSPAITLCHDGLDRLIHDCTGNTKTANASFFHIEPLTTSDAGGAKITVDNAYKITASFVTTDRGYREYTMSTILTNWKR